jgi:hypothetical protein
MQQGYKLRIRAGQSTTSWACARVRHAALERAPTKACERGVLLLCHLPQRPTQRRHLLLQRRGPLLRITQRRRSALRRGQLRPQVGRARLRGRQLRAQLGGLRCQLLLPQLPRTLAVRELLPHRPKLAVVLGPR